VIICHIQTGDFKVIEKPVEEGEVLGKFSLSYLKPLKGSNITTTSDQGSELKSS